MRVVRLVRRRKGLAVGQLWGRNREGRSNRGVRRLRHLFLIGPFCLVLRSHRRFRVGEDRRSRRIWRFEPEERERGLWNGSARLRVSGRETWSGLVGGSCGGRETWCLYLRWLVVEGMLQLSNVLEFGQLRVDS